MNDPMPKPPSGAIHQNRAWRKIARNACPLRAMPAACAGGGVSGTRHAIASATMNVTPPSAMKTWRHVVNCSALRAARSRRAHRRRPRP